MINKEVFLTGGTGFIGANLIYKLLEKKFTVHILVRKGSNPWRLKKIISKLKILEIDYLNLEALSKTLHKIKPSAIYHLAAYGSSSSEMDPQEIVKANINFTVNLLIATQDIPYKVFVNTGSSSEYGFKKSAMSETDPLNPESFYAATKAGATYFSRAFARKYKKPVVTLRPFSVYGPFESTKRFIPTIIKNLINEENINVTKKPVRRDFIYIDDLIDAYVKCYALGKKLSGEIINIGTGIEYSNWEIVNELFKVTGKKLPVKKVYPERSWDTLHWKANTTNARKVLLWKPNYDIEHGLKKTFDWFKKNSSLYG